MADLILPEEINGFPPTPRGNGSSLPARENKPGTQGRINRGGATGPQTERGKRRSSQNAIKFGILSKVILLKDEPRSEYQSLLEGLQESLKPEGMLEELLVEKLATTSWRHRRLLIAEGAEIRKNSEFPNTTSQEAQDGISLESFTYHDPLISRISNPDVFEHCLELLTELMQGIKDNGFDMERDNFVLTSIYGVTGEDSVRPTFRDECSVWIDASKVTEEVRAREGYATPEECKEIVLLGISSEIKRLKKDKASRERNESERKKLDLLRHNVPQSPGLDRLLRYESSLERAFDRALSQLERLQRMRKGQPLPPQLDVKIS